MLPFAPTRFSTMTGCPKLSDSLWPTTRAARSEPPPAGKATTILMARAGNCCAQTHWAAKASTRKRARTVLDPRLQKAQQPRREETGRAAGLVDRLADPEMRGARHDHRTDVMPGLLQRLEKSLRLRAVIDDVVRGAPGDEKRSGVVLRRNVRERRGLEVDAPVVEQARAEKSLDDVIARARQLVVAPLRRKVVDAVHRNHRLHLSRDLRVPLATIAVPEKRVLAGKRDERGEMRARGIAHQRDALGIDAELGGARLCELHRGPHVLHRFGIRLALRRGKPMRDSEHCVAALCKPGAEVAVVVQVGEPPAAAVHGDNHGEFPGALRRIEMRFQRDIAVHGIVQLALFDRIAHAFYSIVAPECLTAMANFSISAS